MYHWYNLSIICTLAVIVWTPTGDVYLETQPSYTIGRIKAMFQEKKGIATGGPKLVFASQFLEDGRTLSDYNIQDGATVNLGRMKVHVPLPYQSRVNPSKYHAYCLVFFS